MKNKLASLFVLSIFYGSNGMALPTGFVYLQDVNPTIIQDMRYITDNNFVGRPIKGYKKDVCILTQEAAQALSKIQEKLLAHAYSLKVYDCYRPQMAVDDFIAWSQDVNDQKMKNEYYPRVNKADVFKLGYVAEKSGHTRGSTIDLTIVDLSNKKAGPQEMAMGTHFDFMDALSHTFNPHLEDEQAIVHRLFLRHMMRDGGFEPYNAEWWHFTLKNEPYPDTYFNFPVG